MKRRFGVLTAIICVAVLIGGMAPASARGFEEIELDIDTHARVDFGLGETDYRAVATIPARMREGPRSVSQVWDMDGVRYTKVNPADPGPAYFDVLGGTIRFLGVGDPSDPTKGFGIATWRFDIRSDGGAEYRTGGLIFDLARTEDREIWRWYGPVIEP